VQDVFMSMNEFECFDSSAKTSVGVTEAFDKLVMDIIAAQTLDKLYNESLALKTLDLGLDEKEDECVCAVQ